MPATDTPKTALRIALAAAALLAVSSLTAPFAAAEERPEDDAPPPPKRELEGFKALQGLRTSGVFQFGELAPLVVAEEEPQDEGDPPRYPDTAEQRPEDGCGDHCPLVAEEKPQDKHGPRPDPLLAEKKPQDRSYPRPFPVSPKARGPVPSPVLAAGLKEAPQPPAGFFGIQVAALNRLLPKGMNLEDRLAW